MNLLDAVNELLKLNKQGITAVLEETVPGTQIRLNKDYPDSAPLELWGTKLSDPTDWEYLGMWNPTINEWKSKKWHFIYV